MKLKAGSSIWHAIAVGVALAVNVSVPAEAATTKIISPGPQYYGTRPVEAAYVYSFIDVRSEFVSDRFRAVVRQRLCEAFQRSRVRCEQLWFSETRTAQRMREDPKQFAMGTLTTVPIGEPIVANADKDRAFAPTHRIIAFPQSSQRWGDGAMLDVRWDVRDASSDYVEWSVYTRTPVISRSMKDEDAERAANSLVDAIVGEMRARKVIPE
jgi:hypothetical protein